MSAGTPSTLAGSVMWSATAAIDALACDQSRGQAGRVGEHAEDQVGGQDLRVAGVVRLVLGLDDHGARAWGEAAESGVGVERAGVGGRLGHEPLLRGLFGDTHALADLGPGGAGTAGLIDEVPDQVVGHLAQRFGGKHRVGQLFQRFVMNLLDHVDEVVEPHRMADLGIVHASTVG